MTEKRFTMDEDGNITDTETDRTLYVENRYTACNYYVNLLNELNDENKQLKDEVYEELDNALTVLTELYEVIPISSQSKMNRLYNRLKSLRDDIK